MTKKSTAPDADDFIWTKKSTQRAMSFQELPARLQAVLRGRPRLAETKTPVSIRLSPEVLKAFRASGAGWQTRVDAALKDWLLHNSPA